MYAYAVEIVNIFIRHQAVIYQSKNQSECKEIHRQPNTHKHMYTNTYSTKQTHHRDQIFPHHQHNPAHSTDNTFAIPVYFV